MPPDPCTEAMPDSKPMLRSILAVLALSGFTLGAAQAQDRPQPRLETIELTAGMHLIRAEVAQTPQQQATGMMFRTSMGANEGMLFVNAQAGVRCFWMRNTLIPLSIAFIADDGAIVNIAEMQPRSDESHCSAKPVRFALEMQKGWFAKRGLQAGTKLRGLPFRP
ncbi:MAG: hypothetical protein ABS84_09395 [Rubrivivax sp. SCN 71-131]|nr:MAG: hypothetical protein ABS84_09395 [Rubrivivax sp. SCN 71-131]